MTEAPTQAIRLQDYYEFVSLPENTDRLFELIDGEFVEKMGSYLPSHIAGIIITYLNIYLFANPIGRASGADGTFRMNSGDVLIPDVAFVSTHRMPAMPERIALVPPDMAIEVMSPTDKVKTLRQKAQRYLDNGTLLVWLVFSQTKTIEVYDGDNDVVTFSSGDTLTGGDVLPGFTLSIAELFQRITPDQA